MYSEMNGKLIIFSAPSGAGKTTLVNHLLKTDPRLRFSVSACSRPMRKGEIHGKDYYFFTPDEFKRKIDNDEFVEWEEVYPGQYYGTLKTELEKTWNEGCHAVFDVDVIGGLNLRKKFPVNSLAIFVQPPSLQELEKRLRMRSTETEKSLKKRLGKAEKEMSYAPQFDVILVNDNLEKAVTEAGQIINEFILCQ